MWRRYRRVYSARCANSCRGPDSSTTARTPFRASSRARMPPAAPAPTMQTSASTLVRSGLGAGVALEIPADSGEGRIPHDRPSRRRIVVVGDQGTHSGESHAAHVIGVGAEVVLRPHMGRVEA